MKKKLFIGIATAVALITTITVNINYNSMQNRFLPIYMMDIEALAEDENDCTDDEANALIGNDCGEGKTCECIFCFKGSIDCTPSCPCCN